MGVFRRITVLGIVFFGLLGSSLLAQNSDDLYIFGFSQTIYNNKLIQSKAFTNDDNGLPIGQELTFKTNTFALHQLDLYFRKPINEKTIFFLNLEASGSYSSTLNSGNFQIPEGWVSYQFTPNMTGKVGLMIPTFNNLNEIKNRLPLLPYLIRPTIYEALFYGVFSEEDYVPQSAYVQFSGFKSLSADIQFDYSFHIGNSESSYASQIEPGTGPINVEEQSATIYKGENLTTKLSFGGRTGIKSTRDNFKMGVSFTFDHDDRNEISNGSLARFPGIDLPVFGDVPRYRLGTDLSFTYKKFYFESEFIGVFHDHSQIHKTAQYKNASLNKTFFYGMLTYNINEQFYAFSGFNQFKDQSFEFLLPNSPDASGVNYLTGGGGWKPFDDIVLKFQYSKVFLGDNPHAEVNVNFITAGLSVIF